MALSKERMRLRKRVDRARAAGVPVKLSQSDEFALLPKYKRKEVLAEIALHRTETPVSAGHRIAAVKEINLMEHVYSESQLNQPINVIFVVGQGYRGEDGSYKGTVLNKDGSYIPIPPTPLPQEKDAINR